MAKGKAVVIVGYDERRPIDKVCKKAENMGIYNVESERRGVAYMYEDDEIVIVTSRGHVRMSVETAGVVADELKGLVEDVQDLRRMRCQR